MMAALGENGRQKTQVVTLEDVERVLAVGRLLLSVLTTEEIERLQYALKNEFPYSGESEQSKHQIGNAGVP